MTEPPRAVFLSYTSQDTEAAARICAALRAAGIEVWFDQSELRGGEAWDRQIRRQIHDCALFVPVLSANAHARVEGYFRLEWKLAVDRSHLMAPDRTFLLPVAIDATTESDERIPDRFRELQWSRAPGGELPPAFIGRVQRLLSPEEARAPAADVPPRAGVPPAADVPPRAISAALPTDRPRARGPFRSRPAVGLTTAVLVLAALAYLAGEKPWIPKRAGAAGTETAARAPAGPAAAPFAPPPHSIAVLPFVNLSGEKDQEYFSDGLTEEILNSLARIDGLQVSARTSSFAFKGQKEDLGTIARKLNVGAILEGSVRRAGDTLRITAQLDNAVTGFDLWSQSYDRRLSDVLRLQTEIADAVAGALKVRLLGDVAGKIEAGGTHNPAAFDAYLRGSKAEGAEHGARDYQAALAAYAEAIRLDPGYAQALAARSRALSDSVALYGSSGPTVREGYDEALADARKSIALAPELAEGRWALAIYYAVAALDFSRALEEYQGAVALAPGNARLLADYGAIAVAMGRTDAGLAAVRRAVVLDPLNHLTHAGLARALYEARRYPEALAASQDALALDPDDPGAHRDEGMAYYALGRLEDARASCGIHSDDWRVQLCLAVTYHKLGRRSEAEAQLAKMEASLGDSLAYQFAEIQAQWGDTPKALDWLETALRLRDPGLGFLRVDPLLDPLRGQPRFQAVLRALRFPEAAPPSAAVAGR